MSVSTAMLERPTDLKEINFKWNMLKVSVVQNCRMSEFKIDLKYKITLPDNYRILSFVALLAPNSPAKGLTIVNIVCRCGSLAQFIVPKCNLFYKCS